MSNELGEFQRLASMSFETWGRVLACEMMLRGLYAKWAMENDDPVEFLKEQRQALIDGMSRQGRDDDPVEALLIQHAEEQIKDTFSNIITRVSSYKI